jgi:hypothetical protein
MSNEKTVVPPWKTTSDLALKHLDNDPHEMVLRADIIKLCAHIEFLSKERDKLTFMIDNGLGWEDMVNDTKYPTGD